VHFSNMQRQLVTSVAYGIDLLASAKYLDLPNFLPLPNAMKNMPNQHVNCYKHKNDKRQTMMNMYDTNVVLQIKSG